MASRYTPSLARLLLTAALLLAPLAAHAQLEQKLTASDGSGGDYFGLSVSVSGDIAIVGAPTDRDNGRNSGSVYVYRHVEGAWVEEQKLTASDGNNGDYFGYSVSVSGDAALIGAPYDGAISNGSAYIFRRVGEVWVEEQKLTASDSYFGDYFGSSVSISGDVALVGAEGDDDNGDTSGSAYVYRRVGGVWFEDQKLTASDGSDDGYFGISVSVSGATALIGALSDGDGVGGGTAYVYRYDGAEWVEEQKLTASDASSWDRFGWSVSVSGDVAVVGASLGWDGSGSAYVFRRVGGAWVEEQKLAPSDGSGGYYFGWSASVSGDVAVVGASGEGSGSAYVFRRVGGAWVGERKFTARDGSNGDNFGLSAAVSGDITVIGAYLDDVNGRDSGATYMYDLAFVCPQALSATLGTTTPAPGDVVPLTVTVTNNDPNPASGDLWLDVTSPVSRRIRLGSGTLPAGATVTREVRVRVPASAQLGPYTFDLALGDLGAGIICDIAPLTVTVVAPTTIESVPTSGSVEVSVGVSVSPNPVRSQAAVVFALSEAAEVRLWLYNALGRKVAAVDAGRLGAGAHQLPLDVSALPAGVYAWRLVAGERAEGGRLTVTR